MVKSNGQIVASQKNDNQAVLIALKLRLSTKNINSGTRIVIIPRKYAKYGESIFTYFDKYLNFLIPASIN